MVGPLLLSLATGLGIVLFLHTERFGKHPSGERLTSITQSPNYKNGRFQNLTPTPMLTEGVSQTNVLLKFFFTPGPKVPAKSLPSVKTDVTTLDPEKDVLIWMGHSSYFMQLDRKTILVDPVLSGYASPVSFTTNAYPGTDIYTPEDLPEIDYLFLSHDHWDHMDYKTLKKLKPKVKHVITGLGNGAHLEAWGFDPEIILEGDWYDSFQFEDGFEIHITPARHFSGRGLKRGQTLWASFVVSSPNTTIYIGGDSGYDTHFREIGNRFGPFDLAILENGQYDEQWKYIHMLPGEQLTAATDLKANSVLPVHAGKFTLAYHDWDEPFLALTSNTVQQKHIRILTPMIGEPVYLKGRLQRFRPWWKL